MREPCYQLLCTIQCSTSKLSSCSPLIMTNASSYCAVKYITMHSVGDPVVKYCYIQMYSYLLQVSQTHCHSVLWNYQFCLNLLSGTVAKYQLHFLSMSDLILLFSPVSSEMNAHFSIPCPEMWWYWYNWELTSVRFLPSHVNPAVSYSSSDLFPHLISFSVASDCFLYDHEDKIQYMLPFAKFTLFSFSDRVSQDASEQMSGQKNPKRQPSCNRKMMRCWSKDWSVMNIHQKRKQ